MEIYAHNFDVRLIVAAKTLEYVDLKTSLNIYARFEECHITKIFL